MKKINMKTLSIVDKYSALIYFILTFIISWGAVYVFIGEKGIPATDDLKETIGTLILLGPFIASFFFTLILDKKEGLKKLVSQLLKWKLNYKWYVLALTVAPLSTLLSVLIISLFIDNYYPAIFVSNSPSNLIVLGIAGGLFIALFEEIGWTGFATPRIRKYFGTFNTGIIIGIIWGAWHFILFWEEDSFSNSNALLLLIVRLFSWLPAYRILMVWTHDKTKSLLVIILMHLSLVASLSILDPILSNNELSIYIIIRALILWLIVFGLVGLGKLSLRERILPSKSNVN